MTRFMEWRFASTTTPEGLGTSLGNPWGDWLNVNENTPVEFIDTCYHVLDCTLMAEMADAIGRRGATRHRTPGRRESHRAMPTSDPGPSMARRWYSLS